MDYNNLDYALEQVGSGWKHILELVYAGKGLTPSVNIVQVKEKFGGLRIYFDSEDMDEYRRFGELVTLAEYMSARTCEYCGASGKIRRDLAWLKCLCKEHYEEKLRSDPVR